MPLNKLVVENYGPIKKADFALTPLHAFIGPNDSGKSTILRAAETLGTAFGGRPWRQGVAEALAGPDAAARIEGHGKAGWIQVFSKDGGMHVTARRGDNPAASYGANAHPTGTLSSPVEQGHVDRGTISPFWSRSSRGGQAKPLRKLVQVVPRGSPPSW